MFRAGSPRTSNPTQKFGEITDTHLGCPPFPKKKVEYTVVEPISINMPYIGSVLSVNSCWIRGRGGVRVNALKPETKAWIQELEEKSKAYKDMFTAPVVVQVSGCFKDNRHPDMDNLFKVICDGLKKGLGIDDKYFSTTVGEVRVDPDLPPQLVIEVWNKE